EPKAVADTHSNHLMGSSKFPLALAIMIMVYYSSSIASCSYYSSSRDQLRASNQHIGISTISASPALLPYPPQVPPDITPLFPTPGTGSAVPPAESSLPTIPSSPSPPNPTTISTHHPEFSISPTGSLPESSALALNLSWCLSLSWILIAIIGFW
ncbi:hypothetical protein Dimus_016071, partial [Dionaea muscipula]